MINAKVKGYLKELNKIYDTQNRVLRHYKPPPSNRDPFAVKNPTENVSPFSYAPQLNNDYWERLSKPKTSQPRLRLTQPRSARRLDHENNVDCARLLQAPKAAAPVLTYADIRKRLAVGSDPLHELE